MFGSRPPWAVSGAVFLSQWENLECMLLPCEVLVKELEAFYSLPVFQNGVLAAGGCSLSLRVACVFACWGSKAPVIVSPQRGYSTA